MSAVGITISHNGIEYSAEVMRVRKTSLGIEDHGIWTAYLHCEGDGTGTGVGGYCLDDKPDGREPGSRRKGSAYGLDWLMQVVGIIGVDKWEDLPGKRIYVLYPEKGHWGQTAKGIANIDTGKALIFEDHAREWLIAAAVSA